MFLAFQLDGARVSKLPFSLLNFDKQIHLLMPLTYFGQIYGLNLPS